MKYLNTITIENTIEKSVEDIIEVPICCPCCNQTIYEKDGI